VTGFSRGRKRPQGLKAHRFLLLFGTAEAVPFHQLRPNTQAKTGLEWATDYHEQKKYPFVSFSCCQIGSKILSLRRDNEAELEGRCAHMQSIRDFLRWLREHGLLPDFFEKLFPSLFGTLAKSKE
jgi:hypothetical protein